MLAEVSVAASCMTDSPEAVVAMESAAALLGAEGLGLRGTALAAGLGKDTSFACNAGSSFVPANFIVGHCHSSRVWANIERVMAMAMRWNGKSAGDFTG